MKKIKGFVMRKVGLEAIIVAESPDLIDFDRIVSLNDSAAYIWTSIHDIDFDTDQIVRLLIEHYDIDETTARKDTEELLKIWLEAGIIEE